MTVSCKIAIVGDPCSGKTSVLRRYISNMFSAAYEPTLEASVAVVVRKVNALNDLIVSLSFLDTPGRDNMDLRKTYFEGLDAAIVVADAASDSALTLAGVWRQLVINAASKPSAPGPDDPAAPSITDIPVILLANKYDQVMPKAHDVGGGERLVKAVRSAEHENSRISEEPELLSSSEEPVSRIDGPAGSNLNGGASHNAATGKPDGLEAKLREAVDVNGFIEGFFVSAKDPDGGIHQAVQFLLHRLAELRLPQLRQAAKATAGRHNSDDPLSNKDEDHSSAAAVAVTPAEQGGLRELEQQR